MAFVWNQFPLICKCQPEAFYYRGAFTNYTIYYGINDVMVRPLRLFLTTSLNVIFKYRTAHCISMSPRSADSRACLWWIGQVLPAAAVVTEHSANWCSTKMMIHDATQICCRKGCSQTKGIFTNIAVTATWRGWPDSRTHVKDVCFNIRQLISTVPECTTGDVVRSCSFPWLDSRPLRPSTQVVVELSPLVHCLVT